jgi:VanZ family protein
LKLIRYWIPAIGVASLIFYLSSLPPSDLPSLNFPHADKWAHVFMYTLLSFSLGRALTASRRFDPLPELVRRRLLFTVLATLIFGVFDEWRQSFVPGRQVEFADLLADFVGGLLGASLAFLYRRMLARWLQQQSSR